MAGRSVFGCWRYGDQSLYSGHLPGRSSVVPPTRPAWHPSLLNVSLLRAPFPCTVLQFCPLGRPPARPRSPDRVLPPVLLLHRPPLPPPDRCCRRRGHHCPRRSVSRYLATNPHRGSRRRAARTWCRIVAACRRASGRARGRQPPGTHLTTAVARVSRASPADTARAAGEVAGWGAGDAGGRCCRASTARSVKGVEDVGRGWGGAGEWREGKEGIFTVGH